MTLPSSWGIPILPGVSTVEYRVNGSTWKTYGAPLLLEKGNYPTGALVEARTVPVDPAYYRSSTTAQRSLTAEALSLTGGTSGEFYNPTGPATMVTNLGLGGRSSEFK